MLRSMHKAFFSVSPDCDPPERATEASVGMDLYASESVWFEPGEVKIVSTGVVVKPPDGCFTLLFARSSLAMKKGLIQANGVGVIDPDYCGPNDQIGVVLYNFTNVRRYIEMWERIAQIVFLPAIYASLEPFSPKGDRGGFGSTGGYK